MKFNKKPSKDRICLTIMMGIMSLLFVGGLISTYGRIEFYLVLVVTAIGIICILSILNSEFCSYYIFQENKLIVKDGFTKEEMSYEHIQLINANVERGDVFINYFPSLKDFHRLTPEDVELFKEQLLMKTKK